MCDALYSVSADHVTAAGRGLLKVVVCVAECVFVTECVGVAECVVLQTGF